jgi:hypothetical protein
MEKVIQVVLSVLDAYTQTVHPEWTDTLLYQVVKLIMVKLDNPVLAEAEAQQLAEQVVSQYHLQGLPNQLPDQKAKAIAAQVADEIAQFQAQEAALGQVDLTKPQILGDLSLSSQMQVVTDASLDSST